MKRFFRRMVRVTKGQLHGLEHVFAVLDGTEQPDPEKIERARGFVRHARHEHDKRSAAWVEHDGSMHFGGDHVRS